MQSQTIPKSALVHTLSNNFVHTNIGLLKSSHNLISKSITVIKGMGRQGLQNVRHDRKSEMDNLMSGCIKTK